MARAWKAVPYGYSVMEAVYRRREDGRIDLSTVAVKPLARPPHEFPGSNNSCNSSSTPAPQGDAPIILSHDFGAEHG